MRKILSGLVVSIVAIAILIAVTERRSGAQGASDADLSAKMDNVLAGQKQILDDMAYIKEELRIIKVRVTQAQ